ncbi:MAG: hypothetical protein GXP62_21270 [Oligoflexia bacterium]|nr:hypothetical protein [Oligoflexia bacterium]
MTLPTDHDLAICVYCPKLCRHVCPVAVGTARESAAPSNMALQVFRFLRGQGPVDLALDAAALCVECGACTRHCDLDRPLGDLLGQLYRGLSTPPAPPLLPPIQGDARHVAIETDERHWAAALATLLDQPVACLRTDDHLGLAALGHPVGGSIFSRRLEAHLAGRVAVVSEHRTLSALQLVGVETLHLADLVDMAGPGLVHHPCRGPRLPGETPPDALACCGATAALPDRHAALARDLAEESARRLGVAPDGGQHDTALQLRSPDSGCANALRAAGLVVRDPIDALLAPAS